jgi:hypothetical protein
MDITIFQIYFSDNQKNDLISGDLFIPYKNFNTSIFLENQVIYDVIKNDLSLGDDYVGFISYKHWMIDFNKQHGGNGSPFYNQSQRTFNNDNLKEFIINNNSDVIVFNSLKSDNIFTLGEIYHPGIIELSRLILNNLGIGDNILRENTQCPIYRNFFAMKAPILKDYVNSFLSKIFDLVETNQDVRQLALRPQINYGKANTHFIEKTGLEYYPLITFTLERLINAYIMNKNLTVSSF